MKIMVAATHHPVTSARFITEALIRLGHEVRHIGAPMPAMFAGSPIDERYVWTPDALYENAFWPDWTPDAVLYMDTNYHPWSSAYDPEQVPHVLYCTPNPVCNLERDMDHFRHFFVASRFGPAWPADGKRVTWLPCGYDPTLHTPSPIPWAERAYDVVIVGNEYQSRIDLVEALRAAGLSVFFRRGLIGQDYVNAYHQGRVGLLESPYKTRGNRTFEVAAMGLAPVSHYSPDDPYLRLPCLNYETADEAIYFTFQLLNYPEVAHELIQGAQEWAKDHTWDNRAQQIIDWLEANA